MAGVDRIGVIGGGLGGLAAACTLAARGHAVTLFERNGWLGGKAAVLAEAGYRFDMGPTILTVPSVLERIFAEAGRNLAEYLDLIRLDPQWRCFYDDGSVLDLHADVERMSKELDARAPGSAAGYRRFLDSRSGCTTFPNGSFSGGSVGGLRDMFDWKTSASAGMLSDVLALRMGRTVGGTVRSTRLRCPRRADARPLHAVRRLVAVRLAGRAVQHRAHADGRRRLVSARRHGGSAGGAGPVGDGTGRRITDRRRRSADRSRRARRGLRHRDR